MRQPRLLLFPVLLEALLLLATASLAAAGTGGATGSSGGPDPAGAGLPEGWAVQGIGSVLLIQTNSSAVDPILTELGVPHSVYNGTVWTGLSLGGYDHVFVAMDGGTIEAASISHVAAYASGGGNLHFLGGSSYLPYVQAVNTSLLACSQVSFDWTSGAGSPDVSITNPNHYLASGLYSRDFVTSGANYFQLRVLEWRIAAAASNGVGSVALFSRLLGAGRFDMLVNSPTDIYWTDPGDHEWLTQVISNMLGLGGMPDVLLVESALQTHVAGILEDLGVGFDRYVGVGWETLDLAPYRHIVLAMNGGAVDAADIVPLRAWAEAGGLLHLLGGSFHQPFVLAVDTHLFHINTSVYNWTTVTALPHFYVTQPSHYLARDLPAIKTFTSPEETFYVLRVTDGEVVQAGNNGDNYLALGAKPLGLGAVDFLVNAPTAAGWLDPGDMTWLTTVMRNMLATPAIRAVADVPGDQGGQVRVSWNASIFDDPAFWPQVTGYAVWRRVGAGAKAAGTAPAAAARVYPPGDWDCVTTVPARVEATYSLVVPTLCDSSAAGDCESEFFVSALTPYTSVYFDSLPRGGSSVDNLAPAAPAGFQVAYGGGTDLAWLPNRESDLLCYRVYRGGAPVFPIGPASLVQTCVAPYWSDPAGDWSDHYLITAVDRAGNESEPAGPVLLTGVDGPGLPERLALHANVPNPFNPRTVLRFEVPAGGAFVTLRVYDARGALVRALLREQRPAGRHEVAWDGRDDAGRGAAAGLYYARLEAGGEVLAVKMTLVR